MAVHVASGLVGRASGLSWAAALLWPRNVHFRILVGGQYVSRVPDEPWRLCTSVLLHVDGLHLALNVLSVLVLGNLLELRIGSARWAAWFAIGGVAGSVVSQLAGVRASDGASGGAYALLGAAVVLGLRWRSTLSPDDRTVFGPVLWGLLAVNLLLTALVPVINAAAHIGGLVAGGLLALACDRGASDAWLRRAEALALGLFLGTCAYGWMFDAVVP